MSARTPIVLLVIALVLLGYILAFERGRPGRSEIESRTGLLVEALVRDTAPATLYHFGATLTGPGEADPQALLHSNVSGVITLFEAARLAGTEQLIFASSIGTYGRDLVPGEPITDLSLQRPGTIYGVTKVFA